MQIYSTSPRMILLLPSGIIPAAFFGKKGNAKIDVGKLTMNSKRSSEINCIFWRFSEVLIVFEWVGQPTRKSTLYCKQILFCLYFVLFTDQISSSARHFAGRATTIPPLSAARVYLFDLIGLWALRRSSRKYFGLDCYWSGGSKFLKKKKLGQNKVNILNYLKQTKASF